MPDELTTAWRKEKRGGRVLVDVARNTYAQTTVAPYAVRALPGAPVATPLAWEELDDPDLHPRRWTLASVPARVAERGDPWARIGASARRAALARSVVERRPLVALGLVVQALAAALAVPVALAADPSSAWRSSFAARRSGGGSIHSLHARAHADLVSHATSVRAGVRAIQGTRR